jgi:multidrug efflux pump subunit AcrB
LGGDAEQSAESMSSVISYLPLSGFIIILLLVVQFNSFRHVTMVMMTIPLGLIGVVVGLLLFSEPFGFMPFLGVISLAGIVINNAIVLLDRIGLERQIPGRLIQDAIVVACLQRFRPILLATFTTVLGLIPLYLSGGEMWEGMAVSIMVGLLFGTLITLLFIPALYGLLYRVEFSHYQFNEALMDDNG